MSRQDAIGFKHVTQLRKLILEKRSGTAWFGGKGWQNEIAFEKGAIVVGAAEQISRILEEPVFYMRWSESTPRVRQSNLITPTRHIFTQAIASLDMPPERMRACRKQLEALPNIRLRYISSFRSDPGYQSHFQSLYHMSLATKGVSLADYFAATTEISEIRARVNIVLGAYCLGDMVPANVSTPSNIAGVENISGEVLARASVASRILSKLREGRGEAMAN